MPDLKLYTYFRSSSAYRIRIALNLKQLSYESCPVNLLQREQRSDDYLKLNKQGLVPTLIDGDLVINQSFAILEYLEERYPQHPLLPEPAANRAHVRSLAQIIVTDTQPHNNLRVLRFLTERLGIDEDQKQAWYAYWISENFSAFEARLANSPNTGRFCFGDSPTVADVCLIPQIYNAQRFDCDLAPYPRINRINEACMSLPAFRAAAPENQPDAL